MKRTREDEGQARLLDAYARGIPGAAGAELLGLAAKGDAETTRYGLERAREHLAATGGRFGALFLMSAGNPVFQQFQYQAASETDDTIEVLPYDGEAPYGEKLTIAKAVGLRRFDYDGKKYNGWTYAYVNKNTRTATNDGSVDSTLAGVIETQRITPDYEDGTAATLIGLSVIRGFNTELEEVEWIDFTGNRAWAVVDE